MSPNNDDAHASTKQRFTLAEILSIAASAYPDEFLREYFDADTGNFNEKGSGDTLAEFIVREIRETFDSDLPKSLQVREACRSLRRAIGDLENVIEALEKAQ